MKTDFDTVAGPHAPTEKILQELGLTFSLRPDGTYDATGKIDLSNKTMRRLPDLSRVHLEGYLACDNCGLETMEGSPASVSGGIWCRNNRFKDFKGISQSVGSGVWACMNTFTSLNGLPEDIGPVLWCEDNPDLVNLFGVPKSVTDLRTPFGNFRSYAQIPPDLLRDLERERLVKETLEKCGVVQTDITVDSPVVFGVRQKMRL